MEETLRGEFVPGMPELFGRVDLIVEEEDALVIGEWKTSRARWSDRQIEVAAEQLLCYAILAADFVPDKPIRLEISVLTKTKVVQIDGWSIDRARRVAERVWHAIQAGNFYPVPSPLNCGVCPFLHSCRALCG